MQVARDYTELISRARDFESAGEPDKAAKEYEQAISHGPFDERPYDRLMVIYRKMKDYEKELKVISKGLEVFRKHYDKKANQFRGNDKLGKLSKALLRTLSGKDKKSNFNPYPEPVGRWDTRRVTVEKKLGK